jgi:cyanate permease
MRRVWAAVMSVWALLALVAVLAWSRPPTLAAQPGTRTAVVQTAHGRRVVLLAPSAHATTQTSPGTQGSVTISGTPASLVSPAPGGGNN